jgi:DNA-binding NtrC family response regulator
LPPSLRGRSERPGSLRNGLSHLAPDWLPADWSDLPWPQLRRSIIRGCERDYLRKHLAATRGRVGETARRTGLSTRSLYLMMQRHALRKEDFRRRER